MWKAALDALLALVPAILKPKKPETSYKDMVSDIQEDLKADIIRLNDKKNKIRAARRAAARKARS